MKWKGPRAVNQTTDHFFFARESARLTERKCCRAGARTLTAAPDRQPAAIAAPFSQVSCELGRRRVTMCRRHPALLAGRNRTNGPNPIFRDTPEVMIADGRDHTG
jgi:hypothetical protein